MLHHRMGGCCTSIYLLLYMIEYSDGSTECILAVYFALSDIAVT